MQTSLAETAQASTAVAHPLARVQHTRRGLEIVAPALIGITALLMFLQYHPFERELDGDPAVFVYISKMAAQGIAPHVSAFNVQASLSFLLSAVAMLVGNAVGVPELIAVRALSLILGGGCVVLTYRVTYTFSRVRVIAITSAAIMMGFAGFANLVARALDPKVVMLVFGLLTVLVLSGGVSRRWGRWRWFWAGFLGACSGLSWQIGWGYVIVAVVLAAVQPDSEPQPTVRHRLVAVASVAVGFVIPLAAYALYFAQRGALIEMVQQSLIGPFVSGHTEPVWALDRRVPRLLKYFVDGSRAAVLFGVLALLGWLAQFRRSPQGITHAFFQNRRTSAVLLSFHGFLLYTLMDFQGYDDWLPLLPYVALFAAVGFWKILAWVAKWTRWISNRRGWARVAILGAIFLAANLDALAPRAQARSNVSWQAQEKTAQELNQQFANEPVFMLGKPELLYFMRRRNPNKFIFFLDRNDVMADAFEPGGFAGVLDQVRATRPGLVVIRRLRKSHFGVRAHYAQLWAWVHSEYTGVKACRGAGAGAFFVRTDLVNALRQHDCLKAS